MTSNDQKPADVFMGSMIDQLAKARPNLCDCSGRGLWPIPAFFPAMLSRLIDRIQREVTRYNLNGQYNLAQLLTQVRMMLLKVVGEGDLGEDHCGIYLDNHPAIRSLAPLEYRSLPFWRFCEAVLDVSDPLVLLGLLGRNEEGSLEEAKKLAALGLIAPGTFADLHVVEEEVHGKICAKIRRLVVNESELAERYEAGERVHDWLYTTILGEPEYQPLMSTSAARRIQVWDDSVYRTLVAIQEPLTRSVLGINLTAVPGVHAGLWIDTGLLGKAVLGVVKPGDTVLDMGTGTGIQGILAASCGGVVTAVDINKEALSCAAANAQQNGIELELLESDGFQNLAGRKFRYIFGNLPFRWFEPKDMLDAASNDENYGFLRRFLAQARHHLEEKGAIFLVFSTTTDILYIRDQFRRYGYDFTIVLTQMEDWREYFVFKLTPF